MENKDIKEIPIRQVILETNGDMVRIAKAEISGLIELGAILRIALEHVTNMVSALKDKENSEKGSTTPTVKVAKEADTGTSKE